MRIAMYYANALCIKMCKVHDIFIAKLVWLCFLYIYNMLFDLQTY